jgi:hypothetical protein
MAEQMQKLQCGICGEQVYVVLPAASETQEDQTVEVTCRRGHTDQYRASALRNTDAKALSTHVSGRAFAAVG